MKEITEDSEVSEFTTVKAARVTKKFLCNECLEEGNWAILAKSEGFNNGQGRRRTGKKKRRLLSLH